MTIVIMLCKNTIMSNILCSTNLWALDTAGNHIKIQLENEIKLINFFAVIQLIMFTIWILTCLYIDVEEIIFNKRYSVFQILFGLIFHLSCLISYIPMTAASLLVVYTTQHAKFQVYLFIKYVARISDGFEIDEKS